MDEDKPLTNGEIGPRLEGEIVAPEGTDKEADITADLKESLLAWADLVSEVLKEHLDDPVRVKKFLRRMDPAELIAQVTKVMNALKKPHAIIMSKNFQLNMQQFNQYANDIANNAGRKKQLRDEARQQLKNIPSRTSPPR